MNTMVVNSRNIVLAFLMTQIAFNPGLFAADWYAEPSIGFSVGFDDNPALVTESESDTLLDASETEDQSFATVFGTVLIGTETERNSFQSALTTNFRRYNATVLDSETIDASLVYSHSALTKTYNLGVAYSENTALETEFLDSGVLEFDVNRQEFLIDPSVTYQISEGLSSETGLSFRKVTFDSESTSLIEFEETGFRSDFTKTMTERLNLTAGLQFLSYKPTSLISDGELSKERSYLLAAGLEYALRENIQLGFSIGPEYSEREFLGSEVEDETDNSTFYEFSLTRAGFSSSITASASRSTSSSALGGLVESDTFSLEWIKPGIADGDFSAAATYQTREDDPVLLTGRRFFSLELGYSKSLSSLLSYAVNYRYRQQEEQSSDEQAESNSISFQLRYSFGRKNISN